MRPMPEWECVSCPGCPENVGRRVCAHTIGEARAALKSLLGLTGRKDRLPRGTQMKKIQPVEEKEVAA